MPEGPNRRFATTRWSLILAARDGDPAQVEAALSLLCELYWFPVYAFVRRTGASAEDAPDLTQGFFTRLLEKSWLAQARQERGRFRAFLLTAVRHFLANERDAARAAKRGGGQSVIALELDEGERRYLLEPVDGVTPEDLFERRWAMTVLDAALARVSSAHDGPDRQRVFRALRPMLTGEGADSSAKTAAELGMTEGALRVALYRLRRQFSRCLREVVGDTVEGPDQVDEELRYLLEVLSRK